MEIILQAQNTATLEHELAWFAALLGARFQGYSEEGGYHRDIETMPPPDLADDPSPYAQTVRRFDMNTIERLVLILTLTPHVRPQLLDPFFTKNALYDRGFSEFGGVKGALHGGFLPTGETAAFIFAGDDLDRRFALLALFDPDHFFSRHNILRLDVDQRHEPLLSGALTLSREYLTLLTTGSQYKPDYSIVFPAKRITTPLDWGDLVLPDYILHEVTEIKAWIDHSKTLLDDWELRRKLKPGFRSLFHGPPGTGKTLTASLLGKSTGLDVYRVDLSQVVSKYIGETEKNLANVFDQAANKNWILFFDEAEALFGKRTQTRDAHDRYANQEIAYLLQRVEDFPGVVILASNLKGNLDEAFSRRFQSMIYFPVPNAEQRLQLWQNAFSKHSVLEDAVDLAQIADEYEVTGGAIINVLRYASLMALRRDTNVIRLQDILQGIRREFRKGGKMA